MNCVATAHGSVPVPLSVLQTNLVANVAEPVGSVPTASVGNDATTSIALSYRESQNTQQSRLSYHPNLHLEKVTPTHPANKPINPKNRNA